MSQQEVLEKMKRYMKFAKAPNYVNKNNEFISIYRPLYVNIMDIIKKNPSVFTYAKVTELNNRANDETDAEIASRKTVLSSDMITKKKLQILLNNYYAFKNPAISLTYQQRSENLLKQIENRPAGIDITDLDKKAMEQAIILILRDGKPHVNSLSSLQILKSQLEVQISAFNSKMQTLPEQQKRIFERQINGLNTQLYGLNNQISRLNSQITMYNTNILPKSKAYIQINFYDKPEYTSYFTEEKKSELITRSDNASEIIQIESFQDMTTMQPLNLNPNIGVM